jgi:hypothetical protein
VAGQRPLLTGEVYPDTPDGRYFVVRGRLWRRSEPHLDEAGVPSWCMN